MSSLSDSFSQAFGASRGNGTPVTEAERAGLYRMEAASAFKAHREYASGPLRVLTSTQPFSSGTKSYALLVETETGALLAISERPDDRESRYRVRGIDTELTEFCDIPRRYLQLRSLASDVALRGALLETELFSREELLLEMLNPEDRELRFLAAVKPRGKTLTVKQVLARAQLDNTGDRFVANALQQVGLITTAPFAAAMEDRSVTLTDDGRFVRHHKIILGADASGPASAGS